MQEEPLVGSEARNISAVGTAVIKHEAADDVQISFEPGDVITEIEKWDQHEMCGEWLQVYFYQDSSF